MAPAARDAGGLYAQMMLGGAQDAMMRLAEMDELGLIELDDLDGLEWGKKPDSWDSLLKANPSWQQPEEQEEGSKLDLDYDLDYQYALSLAQEEAMADFGLRIDPTAADPVASTSKHTLDSSEPSNKKQKLFDWRAAMRENGLTAGGGTAGAALEMLHRSGGEAPQVQPSIDLYHRFRNGAVRMTRTPGRSRTPNTFWLGEVIRKEAYSSVFVSSFLISEPEIFPYLALAGSGPHALRNAPVYMHRDMGADRMRYIAALQDGESTIGAKVSKAKHDVLSVRLAQLWKEEFGQNLRVVHPYTSGIVHSKLVVVEYAEFILVVITSANMMSIDLVEGDNVYFIQAFPRLQNGQRHIERDAELDFHAHLKALGAHEFLKRICGQFDWSACRVHLWTSQPGTQKGAELHDFGLLRLNALVRRLVPSPWSDLQLEVCCGSIGRLKPGWVQQFFKFMQGGDASSGRFPLPDDQVSPQDGSRLASAIRIIYPSQDKVNAKSEAVKQAASNIGCSLNGSDYEGWYSAPSWIRALFHEYISKDSGRLFHLKQFIWERQSTRDDPSSPPALVAFGSANFSTAALGAVYRLANGQPVLRGMANMECGVLMTGKVWLDLLEEGSKWEDSVTYVRPASRYASGSAPWNSPAWVKKK